MKTFCLLLSTILITLSSLPAISADTKEKSYNSVEERRLTESISAAREKVRGEWQNIDLRKKELKTIEEGVDKKIVEIDRKLQELKIEQKKIEDLLAVKSKAEQKRIVSLAKIYDKMTPARAANAMAGLDDKLAADILEQMKTKTAAKLLDAIQQQKAIDLSRTFTTMPIE